MAESVLADAGYVIALLNRQDTHHRWAVTLAHRYPPPWNLCEAALSEAFHLVGDRGGGPLISLLRRGSLQVSFNLQSELEPVLRLMKKYSDVPIGLADACIVRMSETTPNPVVLTTDSDFRIYRRHGRQVIPCMSPD